MSEIEFLRSKLSQIEEKKQFEGSPYPVELCKFPHLLTGRGFFPAGDGLWRDPDPESIKGPATVAFPKNGIMFVGNDFGTFSKYPSKQHPYELHNPTWRFLCKRLKESDVPGELGFFTNALLGLRRSGYALCRNPSILNVNYESMCRDFLAFQIEIQNPRLIVIFRSVPSSIYSTMFAIINGINIVKYQNRDRVVLVTPHPYSDLKFVKSPNENYKLRCEVLREAWHRAKLVNP